MIDIRQEISGEVKIVVEVERRSIDKRIVQQGLHRIVHNGCTLNAVKVEGQGTTTAEAVVVLNFVCRKNEVRDRASPGWPDCKALSVAGQLNAVVDKGCVTLVVHSLDVNAADCAVFEGVLGDQHFRVEASVGEITRKHTHLRNCLQSGNPCRY